MASDPTTKTREEILELVAWILKSQPSGTPIRLSLIGASRHSWEGTLVDGENNLTNQEDKGEQ